MLFVSIAFPPKNDPECIQTAKYFKYLKEKCSIDVVTSSMPTLFMPYDAKLEKYTEGVNQMIEVPIRENKYLNFIKRKMGVSAVDQPDSKAAFIKGANIVLSDLEEAPEIIYSRSYPISSALLAEKLADHYQVPWVLHLSDPWSISPMHNYSGELLKWHQRNEARVFQKAAAICLTSERTLKRYSELYPGLSGKFRISPNVYDPDDAGEQGQLVQTNSIVYTGGLAGRRSASSFIGAMQSLLRSTEDNPSLPTLHFAGSFDRKNQAALNDAKMEIRDHGLLSYSESLELQRSARYLLLIDTPIDDPKNALYFPSKLLDYLLSGKPIIAVTYPGSTVDEVMQDEHGLKLYYGKEDLWPSLLADFLGESDVQRKTAYSLPEEYSAKFQADSLCQLFEDLRGK